LLLAGIGWMLVALIVLRFDYTSVGAISILFGIVAIFAGVFELVLGFWAAGYYGRSAVLLVAWVAAIAVIRGINDIVLAFRVREVQHAPAS
jgi:uncharacterized membrane protein HdeD (DUF308 family)